MNGRNQANYSNGTLADLDDGRVTFSPSERLKIEVHDPVCGTGLAAAGPQVTYDGVVYYFCSQACLDSFVKDPKRYLGQARHGQGGQGR